MEIEEGVADSFSGSHKEFETGDTLQLTYGFDEGGVAFIRVRDEMRDHSHFSATVSPDWDETKLWTWQSTSYGMRNGSHEIVLENDKIVEYTNY